MPTDTDVREVPADVHKLAEQIVMDGWPVHMREVVYADLVKAVMADRATRETAKAEARREALEEAEAFRRATFELLFTDECFIGTHWEAYPDADKGTWPALCAHVLSYGADAEEIPDDEVMPLWKLVEEYGKEAIQAWVCHKRGLDKPVKGNFSERGLAAIRALAKEG